MGTKSIAPCPTGHFRDAVKGTSLTSCSPCTKGSYCNGEGLEAVSDPCTAGYYCTEGSETATEIICPLGYKCPRGSGDPVPCSGGFYQNLTTQSTCLSCPEGYYCPGTPSSDPVITPTVCPEGYYCPLETASDNENPCPPGTFNNQTGRVSDSSCSPCLPKYYCANSGQSQGTGDGLCLSGYYCDGGATDSTQHDCPVGSYCLEGSATPTVCPKGTISTTLNNKNVSDCSFCQPGKYCTEETSVTGVANDCDPGFVCVGGAYVPNPTDIVTGYECPAGFMCPSGTPAPIQCLIGTYQPEKRNDTCKNCDAGFYCPYTNMSIPLICAEGEYCMEKTGLAGIKCPIGTFSNITGLSDSSQCLPCPAGR